MRESRHLSDGGGWRMGRVAGWRGRRWREGAGRPKQCKWLCAAWCVSSDCAVCTVLNLARSAIEEKVLSLYSGVPSAPPALRRTVQDSSSLASGGVGGERVGMEGAECVWQAAHRRACSPHAPDHLRGREQCP